jgi:hypothetical protein
MDALSAIVELVKALAWPVSVFGIIFLLRRAIQGLIGSIHEGRVKYKDLEFTFKRDLEQARQSIEMLPQQPVPALRAPTKPEITDLMSLAQVSPRAAVIEAWTRLEAAGAEFVQKHAPPDLPKQLRPSVMFGEVLRRQDLIPTAVMKAIQKLRDIRNRTVHSPEFQPSVDDAEEYVLLSFAVIEDLRQIGKKT